MTLLQPAPQSRASVRFAQPISNVYLRQGRSGGRRTEFQATRERWSIDLSGTSFDPLGRHVAIEGRALLHPVTSVAIG